MVDEAYQDRTEWIKKSIRTSAKVSNVLTSLKELKMTNIHSQQMGKFNSDRAIMNYAEEYWNIEPCKIP